MNEYNGFSGKQRELAGKWLNEQWSTGAIPKPSGCCVCGQTNGVIHAHSEDYSLPFMAGKTDKYPVCFNCHMIIHCKKHNQALYEKYQYLILTGTQFLPNRGGWEVFKREFLGFRFIAKAISIECPEVDMLAIIEEDGRMVRESMNSHKNKEIFDACS